MIVETTTVKMESEGKRWILTLEASEEDVAEVQAALYQVLNQIDMVRRHQPYKPCKGCPD